MIRLVILESPYAGDIERNTAYARACVRDSLQRGEAPIASHLLYTQPGILRDDVYVDLDISTGMQYGIDLARAAGIPVEMRHLGGVWATFVNPLGGA